MTEKSYYSVYKQTYFTPANDEQMTDAAERAWEKLEATDQEVIQHEIDHLMGFTPDNSSGSTRLYIKGLGKQGAKELIARLGMFLAKGKECGGIG